MAPTPTECTLPSYEFGRLSKRKVVADFSGGDITSDRARQAESLDDDVLSETDKRVLKHISE